MSMPTIVEALRNAGFNVTNANHHPPNDFNIEIDEGYDCFFLSLYDGMVVWHDFTHTTKIAPIDDPNELVKVFKELEPLRNEELEKWIAERPYKQSETK